MTPVTHFFESKGLGLQELKLTDEIYDPMRHYKDSRSRWFGY